MPKKITIVSVDLSPAFKDGFFDERFKGILDMFRFVGLLRGNVKGFPQTIEYVGTGTDLVHTDVARWASFGFKAIIRLEYL